MKISRNWLQKFFENPLPDTETIIQRTHENPFLPKEYLASLKSSYTTNFQRQELDLAA